MCEHIIFCKLVKKNYPDKKIVLFIDINTYMIDNKVFKKEKIDDTIKLLTKLIL